MYSYLYNAPYFSQKCVQNFVVFHNVIEFLHIHYDHFYEIKSNIPN